MLDFDDIKVEFESQGFRCGHIGISPERDKAVMLMESMANTESVICPFCQQSVRMVENVHVTLRDMMIWPNIEQKTFVSLHRYQCHGCAKTFTEHIPFKYPGTRITYRAAKWIKGFLQQKVSIKAVQEMCRLYELTDHQQAFDGWTKWFEAAKESGIPALVKFAIQKECRIPGLAAHAIFQISTGKLEGFNNKIKVAIQLV